MKVQTESRKKSNGVGKVSIVRHVLNYQYQKGFISTSFKLHKPFVNLTIRNHDSEGNMCYRMSQTESTEGTKLDV